MKKLIRVIATVATFLFMSCTVNASEYEIAIANRCTHNVVIHTSEHPGAITLKPDEVIFQYSDDNSFIITTDIEIFGTYENGQSWREVQRMYFYSNGNDRQLEILEDGFWLDDSFIEPMDWL